MERSGQIFRQAGKIISSPRYRVRAESFSVFMAMVKMAVRTIARTSLCHSQQNRSGVVMNSH
jgi:hypothetical protein